jgi:mono/diheme cytochrome c family protein
MSSAARLAGIALCWFGLVATPLRGEDEFAPRLASDDPRAAALGIGRTNAALAALLSPYELPAARPFVLVLTDAGCPLAARRMPELRVLGAALEERGVTTVFVDVGAGEPIASSDAERLAAGGRLVRDGGPDVAASLGATTTTETFLFDASSILRYRGALDDRLALDRTLDAPERRFLLDAVASVLAGEAPEPAVTSSPGCVLEPRVASRAEATVTFHRDVVPILARHCTDCHRDGGGAPFPFAEYGDAARRAATIVAVVRDGRMPPWFAARGEGLPPLVAPPEVTSEERATLATWLAAGKPEGRNDPAKPSDTGPKDAITAARELRLAVPIAIPDGEPLLRRVASFDWPERGERRVVAASVTASEPLVFHFLSVYVRMPVSSGGVAVHRGAEHAAGARPLLVAATPGEPAWRAPPGTALRIPPGASLELVAEGAPRGGAREVDVVLRVEFAPEESASDRTVRIVEWIAPRRAGEHAATSLRFAAPARIVAIRPVLPAAGLRAEVRLVPLGGSAREILAIPRYAAKWPLRYEFETPLRVAAGAELRFAAEFDADLPAAAAHGAAAMAIHVEYES